jgi:hypothetical protein
MICPECRKVISPRFPMHHCVPSSAAERPERSQIQQAFLGEVTFEESRSMRDGLKIKNVRIK